MKKNILITGIAGLIGSSFAQYLLDEYKNEFNIIGIDNLSGGYYKNIPSDINFLHIDLENKPQKDLFSMIDKILDGEQLHYIAHFAAYAAEGLSPFIREYNYSNNLIATAKLINYGIKKNIDRFLFTSSMAVYGNQMEKLPFDESIDPQPIDPYGIAKYACEMDLKCAKEQHGLDYVIIRPHNVFGKKQNIWDRYRNVIGIWMYQQMNDLPLTVYGDGNQTRAFTYIDNIMEPLKVALESDKASGEIINLGGAIETSLNTILDKLTDSVFEGPSMITKLQPRHEVKHAFCTVDKSIDILGYSESVTVYEGLIEMWEWVKLQPNRTRKKWNEYELDENIYDYWK